jgi:ferric-dicitrate binding protein FerR (iron transport regulator)
MTSNDDVTGHQREASDPDFDVAARLLRAAGAREAPPADLEARARARVEAHWRDLVRNSQHREPRWATMGLALAASVALLAAAAAWWITRGDWARSSTPIATAVDSASPAVTVALVHGAAFTRPADEPDFIPLVAGETLAHGSTIETREGAAVALALDDRTSLRIAAGTRAVLRDPSRLDLERGEIYVDRRAEATTAAPARHFEVHTAFGVISEQGTQFAVAVDSDGVRARVREGAVVWSNGREHHRAGSGAEIEWSTAGGLSLGEVAPFGDAWKWALEAAPPVDLEGWTLDAVMAWVGRETGRRVEFVDPALQARVGAERIAGVLVLTPGQAAEIVPRLYGLMSRADQETLFVEAAND